MNKFLHLRIRVKNTKTSVNFYLENFNCQLISEKTSPRGNKLTFLSLPNNNATLELCEFKTKEDFRIEDDLFHLAFEVKNMKTTFKEMTKRGVKFTEGTPNDSMAFIEDPDGYEIELIEPKT